MLSPFGGRDYLTRTQIVQSDPLLIVPTMVLVPGTIFSVNLPRSSVWADRNERMVNSLILFLPVLKSQMVNSITSTLDPCY